MLLSALLTTLLLAGPALADRDDRRDHRRGWDDRDRREHHDRSRYDNRRYWRDDHHRCDHGRSTIVSPGSCYRIERLPGGRERRVPLPPSACRW